METEQQPERAVAVVPSSVTLPLTFSTAFWTQDYRSGFEQLYRKLAAGIVESSEIIAHVERRASCEREFATTLRPLALRNDGFAIDEGGSLKIGFESLLKQAVRESRSRLSLAEDLERNIAGPFKEWSLAHQGRIRSSQGLIEAELEAYEKKLAEVTKLKTSYDELCRIADSAEDELAFDKGPATPEKLAREEAREKAVREKDNDDDEDDDGEAPLFRSIGATLGRAFSARRKSSTSPASPGRELPEVPLNGEPGVGTALDWSKSTFNNLLEKVTGPQTGEARSDKARKEAEATEAKYKTAVEALDSLRLALEETLSEHFQYSNACESDRLKAAASVLRSFNSSITAHSTTSGKDKETHILELVRPERDVLAIIERLRTGPFRPHPTVFVSHYSEPPLTNFGIDLRKYEETLDKDTSRLPPVLGFLLDYITEKSEALSDVEKRKLWLYETPLAAQHHLRFGINVPGQLHRETLERYDLPVVVSTAKLWLLELDVPPILYSHYDEYRALYPARVGTEVITVPSKSIAAHIARLPPVHLEVLRAIVSHWSKLISSTTTEESNEVYLQKLSLSVSRCIIRPKHDTSLTLDDRFPTLLVADLINRYAEIFESVDLLKTKQSEDRYKPRRQRTKPFDVRLTRRTMGIDSSSTFNSAEAEAAIRSHREATSPPPPRRSSDTSTIIAPRTPPLPELPTSTSSSSELSHSQSLTTSPPGSIGSGSSLSRRVRGPRGPRPPSIASPPSGGAVSELGVQLPPAAPAAAVVSKPVVEEGKEEGFSMEEVRRFTSESKGKGKEEQP